jgi:hypothetical protein
MYLFPDMGLGATPKKYLNIPGGQFGEGAHFFPSCAQVNVTLSAFST